MKMYWLFIGLESPIQGLGCGVRERKSEERRGGSQMYLTLIFLRLCLFACVWMRDKEKIGEKKEIYSCGLVKVFISL